MPEMYNLKNVRTSGTYPDADRSLLKDIPIPPAGNRTRWYGIQHENLVSTLQTEIVKAGMSVDNETWTLSGKGERLHGYIDVSLNEETFEETKKTLDLPEEIRYEDFAFDDIELRMGLSHSNDSTVALYIMVVPRMKEHGNGITVEGGNISLHRRHTKSIGNTDQGLVEACKNGVRTFLLKAATIQQEIDMLKSISLNDEAAHHVMVVAATKKIITWATIRKIDKRWNDGNCSNAWDLYLAMTMTGLNYHIFKEMGIIAQSRKIILELCYEEQEEILTATDGTRDQPEAEVRFIGTEVKEEVETDDNDEGIEPEDTTEEVPEPMEVPEGKVPIEDGDKVAVAEEPVIQAPKVVVIKEEEADLVDIFLGDFMPLRNPEMDRVAEQVRKHLVDYLEEHDIEPKGRGSFFPCISKYHNDHDPSMHVIPDSQSTELKCFGCGEHMDIFTAAFHLEGKPLEDAEFVHENLFYLADKYGVPHDDLQFTEEELEEFKTRRFMRDVANVFNEFLKRDDAHPYADRRGWTAEFCREMEVGTIMRTADFYEAVKKAGMWEDKDLVTQGLKADREKRIPRLFGASILTFLVRDHTGQPVGFASRNYGTRGPKYMNTAAWNEKLGAGCRIYDKSSILYGLHASKHMAHSRLDVFEGYSDYISSKNAGLEATCAMGSTAFTTDHLAVLKRLGFTHINFVMDDDETGRKKMTGDPENLADHGYLGIASGHEGIKVTVSMLPFGDEVPKEQRDPDAYFQSHTAEDYLRDLKIFDGFDWELERIQGLGTMTPEEILNKMIDYLGSEANVIDRRTRAVRLARATNYPVDDIMSEYERRFNKDADHEIEQVLYRVQRAKNTKDRLQLLAGIVDKLALAEVRTADLTQNEVVSDFSAFVAQAEIVNPGIAGWDCGFPQLNDATNGIPKKGKWMAVAGGANAGKSALELNILWNIASNYSNENVTAAYMSLDDDRHTAYAKLIAIESGIPINDCAQPHKKIYQNEKLKKKYLEARDKVFQLIKEGRLSIKGEESGNTPQMAERWIQQLQDKFGTNVLLIVDSFNNMELPGISATDDRIRLATLSSWFRRTTQAHDYAAIVTMEERKLGAGEKRGHLQDLFGSGKMSYDLKFAGMVYNDLHARREQATFVWQDDYGNKMPFLEFAIEKNKLSGVKGDVVFQFIPDQAKVIEVPRRMARMLKADADQEEAGEEFTVENQTEATKEVPETPTLDFTDMDFEPTGG